MLKLFNNTFKKKPFTDEEWAELEAEWHAAHDKARERGYVIAKPGEFFRRIEVERNTLIMQFELLEMLGVISYNHLILWDGMAVPINTSPDTIWKKFWFTSLGWQTNGKKIASELKKYKVDHTVRRSKRLRVAYQDTHQLVTF